MFQLGEAAKLKPMEVELKRLEDLSEAIVQDFALMRKREEEMRDTNGESMVFVSSEIWLLQKLMSNIFQFWFFFTDILRQKPVANLMDFENFFFSFFVCTVHLKCVHF